MMMSRGDKPRLSKFEANPMIDVVFPAPAPRVYTYVPRGRLV